MLLKANQPVQLKNQLALPGDCGLYPSRLRLLAQNCFPFQERILI